MKLVETALVLLLMGIMTIAGNTIGYHLPITGAIIGYLIMMAITLLGIVLSKVIPLKLPMVFWISVLAILATSSICPYAKTIAQYTDQVNFLALTTPILAYAGLSIGKDLVIFKKMSWRIVVVSLVVYTGTFLCATAIAEIMLRFEGVI